jgi:PhnB protein
MEDSGMANRLNPYLHFGSRTREAMGFYQSVFGGELTVSSFAEGGMPHDPSDADKVMHAQLDAPNGMTLMASDTPSDWPASPMSGVTISLSGDDGDELSRLWDGLAEGGTIDQPLVEAPWGDRFGMLTDRYGVEWMVNITANRAG